MPYFEDDERATGSLRAGGRSLRAPSAGRPDLDDRLDNLGRNRGGRPGSERRGGRGDGGGRSQPRSGKGVDRRDEASGPCYRGEVVAMRDLDSFGFVKPDPTSGLRPVDIFFHFATGLAEGTDIEQIFPGSVVEFHVCEGRDARSVQPGSGSPRSSTRSGWAAEGRGALSARRRSRPPCCRGVTRSARAWPAVQAALRMAVAPCPAVSKRAPSACAPEAWPLGLR